MIGRVTNISEIKKDINDNKFMFFDIMQSNSEKNIKYNSFFKIRLNNDSLVKYKDFVSIGNNLYIQGFLNSYRKDNKTIYYVYPRNIEEANKKLKIDSEISIIDYDFDGVMVWNGKRCESIPLSKEEKKETENILDKYR